MSPTTGQREPRATFRLVVNTAEVRKSVEAALNSALNSIGLDWQARAKLACPVDTGRLRASITFATPTRRVMHSEHYRGSLPTLKDPVAKPGGVVSYMPPEPPPFTVEVGSNVEYSAPVHEGIQAQVSLVRRHLVRAYTRRDGVTVRAHERGPFMRNVPFRQPTKFIEGPARQMQNRYRGLVERALVEAS